MPITTIIIRLKCLVYFASTILELNSKFPIPGCNSTREPLRELVQLTLQRSKAVRSLRGSPTLLTGKQRGMLLLKLLVGQETLLLGGGEVKFKKM